MEQTIEVRYAGVVIGRANGIADADAHGGALFVALAEPMPVGTALSLQVAADVVDGRVERVNESTDPAKSGMRIRFDNPGAMALFGVAGASPSPSKPAPVASAPIAVTPVASAPIVVAPVVAAPPAVAAPIVVAPVAVATPAAADEAASESPSDAVADGDRGAVPDAAAPIEDSGGQSAGGGRRRRRRR